MYCAVPSTQLHYRCKNKKARAGDGEVTSFVTHRICRRRPGKVIDFLYLRLQLRKRRLGRPCYHQGRYYWWSDVARECGYYEKTTDGLYSRDRVENGNEVAGRSGPSPPDQKKLPTGCFGSCYPEIPTRRTGATAPVFLWARKTKNKESRFPRCTLPGSGRGPPAAPIRLDLAANYANYANYAN